MKTIITVPVVILAVLACGCMAAAPAAAPPESPPATGVRAAAAGYPSLVGTWTGPMQGYDEGDGFSDYPFLEGTMTVSEQHGRLFAGNFMFRANGTGTKTGFAGAIGRDGRTLTITEEGGGYCSGEVLAADEIELTYMQDGSPYSIAIDSFKRV